MGVARHSIGLALLAEGVLRGIDVIGEERLGLLLHGQRAVAVAEVHVLAPWVEVQRPMRSSRSAAWASRVGTHSPTPSNPGPTVRPSR